MKKINVKKRNIAISSSLVVVLLLSLFTMFVFTVSADVTKTLGDVNGDGVVSISDAIEIFKHLSGKTTLEGEKFRQADLNKDGNISISDAIIIFRFLAGKSDLPNDDNDAGDIQKREETININEKFSDKKVTDGESAINCLNDIADILEIDNAQETFIYEDTVSDNTGYNCYRLSQIYKGISVYGRQAKIETDKNGNIVGLEGNYLVIDNINVEEQLSDGEIKEAILFEYDKKGINRELSKIEIIDKTIYSLGVPPQLAYIVNFYGVYNDGKTFNYKIILGNDKTILFRDIKGVIPNISLNNRKESQPFDGQIQKPQLVTVDLTNGKYSLIDKDRKITIHEAISVDNIWVVDDGSTRRIIEWNEDIQNEMKPNESAVDAMANITVAYDYFMDNFGAIYNHKSNGEKVQSEINVVVDIQFIKDDKWGMDWSIGGNAAYTNQGIKDLVIVGGKNPSDTVSGSAYLDTMAHEYTHGIVHHTVGEFEAKNDTGAINEAYADIFSVLVESNLTNNISWEKGRNMANPNKETRVPQIMFEGFEYEYQWKNEKPYPKKMSERFIDNSISDEIYQMVSRHFNSTIISHCAYLMWNGGETADKWAKIDDEKLLANIWYGSLKKMKSDATFSDCRDAVIKSAKQLYESGEVGMTIEQLETVSKAFQAVGLGGATSSHYFRTVKNQFSLNIYDIEKNLYPNYHLKIQDTARGIISKGVVFNEDVKTANKSISLENGGYVLTITNLDNPNQKQTLYINVQDDKLITTDKVDVYTNFIYDPFAFRGHTYMVFDIGMTWHEAKEYCESLGGHLATITSQEEDDYIKNLFTEKGSSEAYWLGGTCTGNERKWSWITGEKWNFTNWIEGEPNNYMNRNENCLLYEKGRNGWNDFPNNADPTGIRIDEIGFICEWDYIKDIKPPDDAVTFNGHSYKVFDIGMTWHEAKAYCENLDGHLATITSQEEQTFIESLIVETNKSYLFIGGYRNDGIWNWVTGEKFNYTNWDIGEPNNLNGIEDCLMLYKDYTTEKIYSTGKWNDTQATTFLGVENYGFICEWDYIKDLSQIKNTVYLENLTPINSDRYTGNMGDSFIGKIGSRNSATGINGITYQHGLEVWVARWNERERSEISWVWSEYDLSKKYNSLQGTLTVANWGQVGYNCTNFETTFEIWGDGELLFSQILLPDFEAIDININVADISTLKISAYDNDKRSGGTSFLLSDLCLVKK